MHTPLRRVCLVWQFWNSILSLAVSVVGLVSLLVAGNLTGVYDDCPMYAVVKPLLLVILTISALNNLYLLTVDLFCTRTWGGTFVIQHIILSSVLLLSIVVVAILISNRTSNSVLMVMFRLRPTELGFCEELGLISALLTAILSLGPLASLSYYFISARRAKDPRVGWLVNTKELVAGQVTDGYPQILGTKRSDGITALIASSIRNPACMIGMWCWNVFFRRVPEVESINWALIMNLFALGSIAALCVRASISLSLAQDRDCRLRTRVEECFNQSISCQFAQFATMYGSSTPISNSYTLDIDIMQLHPNGTVRETRPCGWRFSGPFKVFDCSEMCQMNTPDSIIAFSVVMRSSNTSVLNMNPTLRVWFSDTDPAVADIANINGSFAAPNLLSGWQLLPGYEWRAEIGLKKRKFIMSSFFRDVVAGNYPEYLTINLRPITTVGTMAYTNASVASGVIFPATQGSPAMMDPDSGLPDARSYVGCEVIEEYRDSSPFDILGSIGGLLSLVQGIYIWLFGRPLLWSLTGAKVISPFGLIGNLSRSSFRERLRNHYQIPGTNNEGLPEAHEYGDGVRMNKFLLDYVLDMGPVHPSKRH